ncbi:alpha/beta hydrolase [Paenibacillus tengchongensis]|uniref:alpha/beta hydrolase n=1 Tax=Paenibacillus tengchongensis TaxID=2608684 RepID=UPI001FE491C0|nr:alpha/beta hydrolase [Paenibacillus tengchongensis]
MLALVILVIGGVAYAGVFFYRLAIKRTPKEFLAAAPDLAVPPPPVSEDSWGEGSKWLARQPLLKIQITADDGLRLQGHYLAAERSAGKTAILAHGYSGKGKDMGAIARLYSEELGYNVLMPDARGHGESEGNYIGFGWPERRDYLQWISRVIDESGKGTQIVLHGVSMGAATVLMTAGESLPPQVKAIVADCGYTSVVAQLSYQLRRMYHLPSFPFIQSASLVTKLRAGYFFSEASALKQVRKAEVPILFIHGDADTFVPYAMMEELYQACRSPKDKLTVHGAGHGLAYQSDKAAYTGKVSEFLSKYVH